MCGILAVFNSAATGGALRTNTLQRSKLLRHRGPDCNGIVIAERAHAIAHERLAIVDAASGIQPFESAGLVLSVNGEIYNHEALCDALQQPFAFSSYSDCEVLMPLYLESRADGISGITRFLNRLVGMFAFVLYDSERDAYVVARDHMGIIPLYMGTGTLDGSTWFASEMKALVHDCVDIRVFPPGHVLVCLNITQSRTSLADGSHSDTPLPPPPPNPLVQFRQEELMARYTPAQQLVEWYTPAWKVVPCVTPTVPVHLQRIRSLLQQSVGQCMESTEPWGVLLSGGLDSSLVAAIASHFASETLSRLHVDEAGWQSRRVNTFSIGLRGSPDIAAAESVAAHLGTRHRSFTFTVQQGLDVLRDVIYHLETYDVTSIRASVPMFLMSRRIKALGIKMVLSGEGADEIFGGYLYFHKAPCCEAFHAETVDKLNSLHLYDCNRANKAMAAWGVETRVPFLDKAFVDYCMSFDPVNKMIDKSFGFIEKFVLRSAFPSDILPPEVLWRQKEQFSDGVGYGWIDGLKAHAEQEVSDTQLAAASSRFPLNTPLTKEAYHYRELFEDAFPVGHGCEATVPFGFSIACSTARAADWDATFRACNDPSGRVVAGVHEFSLDTTSLDTTTSTTASSSHPITSI
jgi:asparagine synthase (glutamine-hydrolysing)